MSDNNDDDRITPILFPNDNRPHTEPIFGPEYQNSTAIPLILNTREEGLAWLNKSYACIMINGKYKVLHEKSNGEIEIMDIADFKNS